MPFNTEHRTPECQDRRGSCKLTGTQTDTETHGRVGKLLGRQGQVGGRGRQKERESRVVSKLY
ncbi:hypothetical protein NQZ68_020688 [Dissostichus eleginoides]|nr:hypothetical protein NQZ68_020688 [Dissostichus eleginoides]